MVYDEYAGSTMPYYQFQQQQVQTPFHYNGIYDDQSFYYQPNFPPMNAGYMPPYMNGGYAYAPFHFGMNGNYMYPYPYEINDEIYHEPSSEGIASSRVIQQFLDENGQVDIQKMLSTVGQFADTVQQVSPVIKQLNDLVRSFRS